MSTPNPTRFDTRGGLRLRLAFLLAAGGLGLCLWFGQTWLTLPHYSQADIQHSAELNLALDEARLGQKPTEDSEQHKQMLKRERADVVADIKRQRDEAQAGIGAGLLLLVLAAGQYVAARLQRRNNS